MIWCIRGMSIHIYNNLVAVPKGFKNGYLQSDDTSFCSFIAQYFYFIQVQTYLPVICIYILVATPGDSTPYVTLLIKYLYSHYRSSPN